jgi:hypothetical protein
MRIPDEIPHTENYTPTEFHSPYDSGESLPPPVPSGGGRPSWINDPGVTRTARLARPEDYPNYGRAQRAQSGGLTNRVMQYQGDVATGVVNPPMQEAVDQPRPGAVQQSSDMIQQMMDMLRFSGGGGVKSLPIENQANIRQEFESMTEPERQQWINFMTSPGTTEQSPTRADPESELIERIMQQQSGGQIPLGSESFQ